MSYFRKGRGRGRSQDDDFSRYSEHDDRIAPPQRDYDQKSFRGKVPYRRGSNRRGGGNGYRGSRGARGGNSNYRGNFRNDRGTRRPYGSRGRRSSRDDERNNSPFHKDEDGDIRMEGDMDSDMRYKPYARPQKNTRNPKWRETSRHSWFQVTIVNGNSMDEEWLHEQIQSISMSQYTPVQYHIDGKNSCFFVEDKSSADAIRSCSKKFSSEDGQKVLILTRPSNFTPFSDTELETIQKILAERYKAESQHIDLSSLYHEPKLRDQRRIKLDYSHHAYVLFKIIEQNIPSLLSIDLSSNNLNSCESFKSLVSRIPTVQKLNLEKNKLQNFKELFGLKSWDLIDLTLDQNPLCSNYKSQTDYISDARDYFPNLATLDGHQLPPPVKFDVDSGKLPTSVRDFLSPAGQDVINSFVQNYFACYDQSRMGLLEAYNEFALLTIVVPSSPRGPPLSKYVPHNRNLKKIKSADLKLSTISSNRSAIFSKLNQLPPTNHVTASFAIDVPLVTSTIVKFVVRGLFEETVGEKRLRGFSRCFFCQVVQSNLQIINEQYFIRNPTASESKELKTLLKAGASRTTPQSSQPQPTAVNQRQEMIAAFMKESNMNVKYSEQCLAENSWNYIKAGEVFLRLKSEGKIPPEAFQ